MMQRTGMFLRFFGFPIGISSLYVWIECTDERHNGGRTTCFIQCMVEVNGLKFRGAPQDQSHSSKKSGRPEIMGIILNSCVINKFWVREWTVRESTGNFSYGNGRYENSRTMFYDHEVSSLLSIIIQLSSKIATICVKKFVKNEIRRAFLRDLLVLDRPGNFVREWTVRERTGNFSYGDGRYGKSGNFRTVSYRTGNFPYRGSQCRIIVEAN